MSEQAAADTAVADALGVGEPVEDTQPAQAVDEGTDQPAQNPETDESTPTEIDDLPEWAQSEIRKARREAAASRVKAREAEQDKMSEAERIRAEIRQEYAEKLATSEVRAALSDLKSDHVDDIIDSLNLSKFVNDDGDVDRPAVKAFAARVLGGRRRADVGAGSGSNGTPRKRTTAEQFAEAINPMFTT